MRMTLHSGDMMLDASLVPVDSALSPSPAPPSLAHQHTEGAQAIIAVAPIDAAVASVIHLNTESMNQSHHDANVEHESRVSGPCIDYIIRLCQEYESGPKVSRRTFAKERGMSRSAFDRHWRNYAKGLYSRVPQTHKRRRVRESKYAVVERCLVDYILSDVFSSSSYLHAEGDESGRPALSWSLLQVKAVQIAREQLGAEEAAKFKASPGWLHRVFERNDCLRPALLSGLTAQPMIEPSENAIRTNPGVHNVMGVMMPMQQTSVSQELDLRAADISRMHSFRTHMLVIPMGPNDEAAERAREEEEAVLRSLDDVEDGGAEGDIDPSVRTYPHRHHHDDEDDGAVIHAMGEDAEDVNPDHAHLHHAIGLEGAD